MKASKRAITVAITVAIDGPAGAGKSTVAKRVAQALGYTLVDTGAIYRATALLARRRAVEWDNEKELARLVRELSIRFVFKDGVNRVYLNDEDVTDAIRTPEISMGASQVSSLAAVRAGLLDLQRCLAGRGGAVLEGRDIGTTVFPEAEVKFYLDASDEERARRRYDELRSSGRAPPYEQVLAEQRQRDLQDTTRSHAPLRPAEDAVILDTTKLTIDDVVQRIVEVSTRVDTRKG